MTPDYKRKLNLTNQPGSYILVLYLPKSKKIVVGKWGLIKFPSGYYLYVGSAGGPGGLISRLNRHLTSQGKKYWHIDYLKTYCKPYAVIYQAGKKSRECAWSKIFSEHDKFLVPCLGFGASDCKCRSHLFYTEKHRDLQQSITGFLKSCSECCLHKL